MGKAGRVQPARAVERVAAKARKNDAERVFTETSINEEMRFGFDTVDLGVDFLWEGTVYRLIAG